jgi:hypothetical protein
MAYLAVDIEECRTLKHRLVIAGSDKAPMKKNIICETCSLSGKTAYAAFGIEEKSFGPWISRPKSE